jgi:hypothetical protein
MTQRPSDIDARLSRLERIGAVLILERHGIGMAGLNFSDVAALKRQAIGDSAAILNELNAQPPIETRAA